MRTIIAAAMLMGLGLVVSGGGQVKPPVAGYCIGVQPLCIQGHPICVCDTTGLNCWWACK